MSYSRLLFTLTHFQTRDLALATTMKLFHFRQKQGLYFTASSTVQLSHYSCDTTIGLYERAMIMFSLFHLYRGLLRPVIEQNFLYCTRETPSAAV